MLQVTQAGDDGTGHRVASFLSLQGDTEEWRKPPFDLVLTAPAAGGPLLQLPTGAGNITSHGLREIG